MFTALGKYREVKNLDSGTVAQTLFIKSEKADKYLLICEIGLPTICLKDYRIQGLM
jgi:hypothetical protein